MQTKVETMRKITNLIVFWNQYQKTADLIGEEWDMISDTITLLQDFLAWLQLQKIK